MLIGRFENSFTTPKALWKHLKVLTLTPGGKDARRHPCDQECSQHGWTPPQWRTYTSMVSVGQRVEKMPAIVTGHAFPLSFLAGGACLFVRQWNLFGMKAVLSGWLGIELRIQFASRP
jgi:hypothetical protein